MRDSLTWVDPDGGVFAFSEAEGITPLWGVSGRFMPTFDVDRLFLPLRGGNIVQRVRTSSRNLIIPVRLEKATRGELRLFLRAIARSLDPSRGDGILRSTDVFGQSRELFCRYEGGFEVTEDQDDGVLGVRANLVFGPTDPYWRDASSTSIGPYAGGAASTFFPFGSGAASLIRLSDATVFAEFQVDNTGDAEAFPVWIIEGPGTITSFRNLTSERQFVPDRPLLAGETIVVDAEVPSIQAGGENLWPVTAGNLWTLRRGVNVLSLQMTGTSPATKISGYYHRRHLTA